MPGRAGPARIGGAVVAAQVAETGGAQQRIADRVRDDIAVGVTLGAHRVVEDQTGHGHGPARRQTMDVDAETGAQA